MFTGGSDNVSNFHTETVTEESEIQKEQDDE